MDIVESVFQRLKYLVYPVMYSTLKADITNQLEFQLRGMGDLTSMRRAQLIDRIVKRFMDALTKEYEPVGINTALVIGESLVQSSLSSHHHAGIKSGATGFDRIQEITDLKSTNAIVRVVPTSSYGIPRSKEDINTLANSLVRIDLDQLKTSYEVINGEQPVWYPVYIALNNMRSSEIGNRWMRIRLDKDKMYQHRISPRSIVNGIQDTLTKTDAYALYPPAGLGEMYIDIHLGGNREEVELYNLIGVLLGSPVGGIPSVKSAFSMSENMLNNLYIKNIGQDLWQLSNKSIDFAPPEVWINLITLMLPDVEITNYDNGREFSTKNSKYKTEKEINYITVQCPVIYEDALIDSEVNMETGEVRLQFNTNLANEYPYLQHALLMDRVFPNDEEAGRFLLTNMLEHHLFWYIEAVCPKFQDIFILTDVDTRYSYTTSPMNCIESLGYLATRNMLYQEFRSNMSISAVHPKLALDNITALRVPVSINRHALANDRSEPLTSSTFEDSLKYVARAAFCSETDHMRSVSSKLLTGEKVPIGTGSRPDSGNKFAKLLMKK